MLSIYIKSALIPFFLLAFGTAVASADVIADRKAKMKSVGKAVGSVARMAKGATEFDGDAALAAFVSMKEAARDFSELFPEGTETGGKTEAGPAIFSDRAGFEAKNKEFIAALEMVINAGAPADLNALRGALGQVGANCKACHQTYRAKN